MCYAVTFTTRFRLDGLIQMTESEETGGIIASPISQNFYIFIWTLASVASFAIFVAYW